MTSLKYLACFSALISIGMVLAIAACSAESVGQSAGTTFTKVAIQGPTSGHTGDTLAFTCRVSNCSSLGNESVCQEILSGPLVVFYVEAPSSSDNQMQQGTVSSGQAQASFIFTKPGQYVVSAITDGGANEMTIKITSSAGQTQGTEEAVGGSNTSTFAWVPVFGIAAVILFVVIAALVTRHRRS